MDNGRITTHPDSIRQKLNLHTIRPNLIYLATRWNDASVRCRKRGIQRKVNRARYLRTGPCSSRVGLYHRLRACWGNTRWICAMPALPLTTILLLLDDSGLTWPRTIPNRLKGNICQEIT